MQPQDVRSKVAATCVKSIGQYPATPARSNPVRRSKRRKLEERERSPSQRNHRHPESNAPQIPGGISSSSSTRFTSFSSTIAECEPVTTCTGSGASKDAESAIDVFVTDSM